MILWKGFRREDAELGQGMRCDYCGIEISDKLCGVYNFHPNCTYHLFRTFTIPLPEQRLVLNAASSLSTEIVCSLKCGLIRRCMFTVPVRRDVFNFLFSNLGTVISRKPGKFYVRSDFCNDLFSDSDFMYTNTHKDVVCVVFPVYMYV